MTKHALNVHAGHDDYHAVDDTGFFQLFAKDVQESADLNLIAHRIAELSLNPGLVAQDGFLTSHVIESRAPAGAGAGEGVPGRPRRPDRLAHARAAAGLRREAPPHPGAVRLRLPGDAGHGPEPGLLRPGRRRAAALLLRPHRRAHRAGDGRVRRPHRPPLRARHRLPPGRRRVRASWARARWSPTPRRWPTTCARRAASRSACSTSPCSAPSPPTWSPSCCAGKKGVAVLERTDQPLAVDAAAAARDPRGHGARRWRTAARRRRQAPLPRLAAAAGPRRCRTSTPAASASAAATCSRATWWPRWTTCCPRAAGSASSTWASTSSARARACPSCRSGRSSSSTPTRTWRRSPWSRPATSTCCPRGASPCASTPWAAGAPSPWGRTWR